MADHFLMKGKVFGEHQHKLVYPVIVEIKHDEIRCRVKRTGDVVEFLSYDNKPLHNLGLWADAFLAYMHWECVNDLDIGVLVNGNFNDSYRWCRSSSGIPKGKLDKKTGKAAPALDVSMVQFYLFDIPADGFGHVPFRERVVQLDDAAWYMLNSFGLPANRPNRWFAHGPEHLDRLFLMAREQGHEGLMVKTMQHTYQCGRRIDGWLKMKPENSEDGVITKVNQAFSIHGEPLDRAGSVDVSVQEHDDMHSFASPAGIPHELGRLMWANPQDYVGQWCEFKYMERDRQGGYRHPSLVRLRESK